MNTKQKWTASAAVVLAVVAVTTMVVRQHNVGPIQQPVKADMAGNAPLASDVQLVDALRAQNLAIRDLSVRRAGEIVILRGQADPETAETAVATLKSLGVARVANMVTPATEFDDDALRGQVERKLARLPALQGCRLSVRCDDGVVSVAGTVQRELQKDAVRTALRGIRGTRDVKIDLTM